MSLRPASNCPVTGLISKGRVSNDCDNDMLLSLCTKDSLEDGTEETDLSPVSVLLLLLEDDDTEDTDTEDTEDEDLGTGLRVTAEVGGGGGMRPGPGA